MFIPRSIIRVIVLAVVPVVWLTGAGRPVLAADYRDLGQLVFQLRNSPDEEDRGKAAKELGKIGDARTLPVLQQAAVYDSDKSVRKNARNAVLKITGGVAPRQNLVLGNDQVGYLTVQMIDARKDDDRERAAKELGRLRDPRVLPALEIAAIFNRDGDVRDAARKSAELIRSTVTAAAPVPPAPAAPQYRPSAPPPPPQQYQGSIPGIPGQQGQPDANQQANGNYNAYAPPAPIYGPAVVNPPPPVYSQPTYVYPPAYAYPPTVVYTRPAYVYPPVRIGIDFGFIFGWGGRHHR